MKFALFLSAVVCILLVILVCVIIVSTCPTPFQRLVATIGFMIIILLMNIGNKIDELINKK